MHSIRNLKTKKAISNINAELEMDESFLSSLSNKAFTNISLTKYLLKSYRIDWNAEKTNTVMQFMKDFCAVAFLGKLMTADKMKEVIPLILEIFTKC